MNNNTEERADEVQGIEMIDLGDVAEETKEGGLFPTVKDSCCTYTYLPE